MRQILFKLPLHSLWDPLPDIPIYGYGSMLFLAFVFCLWLASRLGRREGISKETIQDIAMWVFVGGIVGARAVFLLQYGCSSFWQIFKLWDGGLVFYGGPVGAVAAYFIARALWMGKRNVSSWKMADVIAPCAALGLALGRIGCLLNGCCYGNVACPDCPAIHFPLSAPPMDTMVKRGYQTSAGFTAETYPGTVHPKNFIQAVEIGSVAAAAGLRQGDEIVKVNETAIANYEDLDYLLTHWPRGQNDVELQVARPVSSGKQAASVNPYRPETLGLHPTQIYETISMVLLLFFLLSYYPFKTHDGSVMVFFMVGYAVHRFLNEMLRTDTEPVAFNMTLSQNISIVVALGAAVLALAVWRHGANSPAPPPPPPSVPTSSTTATIPT